VPSDGSMPSAAGAKLAGMAGLLNAQVWSEFFGQLDRCCTDALATVQFQTRGEEERNPSKRQRRLRSIRYDGERDVVELSAGGGEDVGPAVRYFIRSPRRITVEEVSAGSRILIEDRAHGVTAIALEESRDRDGSNVAVELGRRFTRDPQASPGSQGRSLVGRLTMRRHAGARSG
jgi:hypothetical protein